MTSKERRKDFWERNRKSGGYLLRKKIWNIFYSLCRAVLVFGLCFLILQPLLNKVSISFMTESDLYDSTIISIPRHFSTSAYEYAWSMLKGFKTLGTSFYVALLVALCQVLSCTLVGYGFARYKFPGKNILFACVILLIIVPPQAIITPLYLRFQNFDIFGLISKFSKDGTGLNLLGKMFPYLFMCLTCAGYKAGLYIYLLRQHFRNEPKELEEAAYVDGCSRLRTFFQILLPGAKPIMVSCFLFAFVWQWTDQYYSRVFFPSGSGWNLISNKLNGFGDAFNGYMKTIKGQAYMTPQAFNNQVLSTAVLISLVPLIIIYIIAQKSFVESITSSGIKG